MVIITTAKNAVYNWYGIKIIILGLGQKLPNLLKLKKKKNTYIYKLCDIKAK